MKNLKINACLIVLFLCIAFPLLAQKSAFGSRPKKQSATNTKQIPDKPALIVGIVIDQMRYDLLYKYLHRYGKGGFRRLLDGGFSCENTQYDYTPTYTGPGHSSIYTGTTPGIHGICANDWYDRTQGRTQYCTADTSVRSLGSSPTAGQHSPRHLLSTTICDQLRLGTGLRAKTIGICLKDRGSILPAGHLANAAYWFESQSGNWISSTFYMKSLPSWVNDFNAKQLSQNYLANDWNTLYPIGTYTQSTPDNQPWEATLGSKEAQPIFPHRLPQVKGKDYELLKSTPFGNTLTASFAIQAIVSEELGTHPDTDFLALSFSSTDYVGHKFGPNSVEIEDTYLRLDQDLANIFEFLDGKIGQGRYLVFLTADHGVAPVPAFAKSLKSNAGVYKEDALTDSLNRILSINFKQNEKWIEALANNYIFFDRKMFVKHKKNVAEAENICRLYLESVPFVAHVLTRDMLSGCALALPTLVSVQRGYLPARCGDMAFVAHPGWFDGWETGTTHGVPYAYDTHVPLLWYGWHIKNGKSYRKISITDIAPTIASMMQLLEPSGSIGQPIMEILR